MSIRVRRTRQRGSALLIVFVFAAMLAIMLYREMPVVAFEAQRQREELLIDRGNEYKRAIKLYVRKFQTFPASLEALENTNRMRFLRNRYVDPYSGKDDWRLLHAGPGGIITDSKIKPKNSGLNGASNAADTSNGNASTSSNASSSNLSATDPNALLNGQSPQGNAFPTRPPAVSLDGGNVGASAQAVPGLPDPQAMPPVPSAGNPYPGYPGPPVAPIPGQTDASANGPQPATAPDGSQFPVARSGRFRNANLPGDPNGVQAQSGAAPMGNSQDPQSMMQALLNNNNNPQPTAQTGNSGGTAGNGTTPAVGAGSFNGAMNQGNATMGGGIAGVASKTAGRAIKVINDQTDRSLWEFVYDMQKELMANAPGRANGAGLTNGANGANGTQTGMGTNSTFNSPGQTNTIGSTNTFGSGFGNSGSQTPVLATPLPIQPSNQ